MISNIQNSTEYMNTLRDIETGRDEPEPHQYMRAATVIADDIYRMATDLSPTIVADDLLNAAYGGEIVPMHKLQTLMAIASIMILQLSATRDHYKERTREMETTFGSVKR